MPSRNHAGISALERTCRFESSIHDGRRHPRIVVSPVQELGASDPDTGARIRDGTYLASIAAGPRGDLAVVWQDARFSGGSRDGIAFSRSLDGGLTWSTPARINAAPGVPAFVPTVHITRDGTIGVSYYDLRSNTPDPATLLADHWLTRSTDGVTWRETRLAGPFDLDLAPRTTQGYFLGDYQALLAVGESFLPIFVQANADPSGNAVDVVLNTVNAFGVSAVKQGMRGGAETHVRAQTAAPLVPTPELAARLRESTERARLGRLPGR